MVTSQRRKAWQWHAAGAKAYLAVPVYARSAKRLSRRTTIARVNPAVAAQNMPAKFPRIWRSPRSTGNFGGWRKAQQTYFADGGVFDQIMVNH